MSKRRDYLSCLNYRVRIIEKRSIWLIIQEAIVGIVGEISANSLIGNGAIQGCNRGTECQLQWNS